MAIQRGALPDDLAEALLALDDPEIAFLINRDDRVSPAIRARIANDPALREATRQNARDSIAKEWFLSLDELERLTDSAGPEAWRQLVGDPDPKVRLAVAKAWFDAPPDDIRRILLTDPDPSVRAAACQRPPPPPSDLHASLIGHPATRASVAEYISLTEELAAELAADNDEEVRLAVARNPHLPGSVRDRLAASNDPIVWAGLILNQTTPESLRARLNADLDELHEQREQSEEVEIARLMALVIRDEDVQWLAELPLHARMKYLDSPYAGFRRTLARHGNDLPAEAIAKLQRDPDLMVRETMARRPDAPAELLERIVREHGDNPKYRPKLVDHPNFPKTAFATFANSPEPRLRALACRDPQLPALVVARLSGDTDAFVRRSTTGHPNLPIEDLMRLLDDEDLDIVEAAAASAALPLNLMHQLVNRATVS